MNGMQQSSTHPPTPHPTEDTDFDRLRLLRSYRVGISTYNRLTAEHGSARAALAALPDVAKAAGVDSYRICPEPIIEREMAAAKAIGAKLIVQGKKTYPASLNTLDDAPPVFWTLGASALLERRGIALVGARNASSLGTRMARKLASELSEAGFVVISGLARGIDAAAHMASLEAGTIAVLAGGVDTIYPAENTKLTQDIRTKGLCLSEAPMGMQAKARDFPRRNRLISGLAEAVVIVEAAAKSGSLLTARNALDQNRDVLAVPGHPFDARASGCNMLIRDGATLVRSAQDVIDALQPFVDLADPCPPPATLFDNSTLQKANDLHQKILARLGPSPVAEDQLIRDLGTPAKGVAPALVELEINGQVIRQPGGLLSKAH